MKVLPSKEYLISKLITNFSKPNVEKIYLILDKNIFCVNVIMEPNSFHIIANLIELEEVITNGDHTRVKFLYIEDDQDFLKDDLIWQSSKEMS